MTVEQLRLEVAAYGNLIVKHGLAVGAGGNISAREGDTMLISPTGYSLADATPEDYVAVSVSSGGIISSNGLRPSSEVLMHLACYRQRPEIRAVVHTHPPHAIALVSSGHDLRPIYAGALIYLGADIPHVDYITVTTAELAAAVEERIQGANCILLRNHGAVTVGESLKQAFWRACTVEEAAHIQLLGLMVGKPRFLDRAEAERLRALGAEQ